MNRLTQSHCTSFLSALRNTHTHTSHNTSLPTRAMSTSRPPTGSDSTPDRSAAQPSRYESQKRRDWTAFCQYLRHHHPPLALPHCSGGHVLEFLRHLDQFGKTRIHEQRCPFFGRPQPPAPCACPLRQAWGSLDALIGRLRAAFEENGGEPSTNPFAASAIRLYLREVRDTQSMARGIAYEKKKSKKRKRQPAADRKAEMTPGVGPLPVQ